MRRKVSCLSNIDDGKVVREAVIIASSKTCEPEATITKWTNVGVAKHTLSMNYRGLPNCPKLTSQHAAHVLKFG